MFPATDAEGGGEAPADPGRLVTIARALTATEAHLTRTILQQGGIEAVVADEQTVWTNWFLLGAIGGVKVQVWENDLPAALELLRQPLAAFPALPPDAEPPVAMQTACPVCGGTRMRFKDGGPEGFVLVWLEKLIPLPLLHGRWICDECGKRWIE